MKTLDEVRAYLKTIDFSLVQTDIDRMELRDDRHRLVMTFFDEATVLDWANKYKETHCGK